MDALARQLLNALEKIDRPGTFCTSGLLPATLPGLEVAGVGPVPVPLDKRLASVLKNAAHPAPYGKGTQTLVDTDVRRVWEIDADQVVLANPQWADVLKEAVDRVQSDLGLERQTLRAHLYKLLLYEPGSFFLAHRDGEKLDRMVATLVIALPSAHEGGELVVRHEGREKIVDFSPHSAFQTQFAAFYADCEHEIRPVTKGYRLALVYNLTLEKAKGSVTAPTNGEHIAAASDLLRRWSSRRPAAAASAETPPPKLAVLLDHKYTQVGLTRDALKGIDRARADVLFAAARKAGCDASLALVTYWESGSAEPSDYDYGYRRRRYGWHDASEEGGGEHEMGEVFDSSLTAEQFRDAEGNPLPFGQLPLDEEELVSRQPLHAGEPDREEFEGYTGNAGMTLERWYHRAAVVLWPAPARFDVLCRAGVRSAVGGLEQMVRQWQQAGPAEREGLRQTCLAFAGRIIAHWPERKLSAGYAADYTYQGYDDEDEGDDLDFDDEYDDEEDLIDEDYDAPEEDDDQDEVDESGGPQEERAAREAPPRPLLELLDELGDAALIAAWIHGVLVRDVTVDPGTTLGDVCKRHGWATFRNELLEVFDNTSNETLERDARLLADLSQRKDKSPDRRSLCSELAHRLLAAVERWDPEQARRNWQARVVKRSELLPPLTQALLTLEEPELLQGLVTYVLNRPKAFDLTTVQIPALLALGPWLKRNVKHASAALEGWLKSVADELETRKAQPPQEPTDWRRESTTGCKCADCQALGRFLRDPRLQTLRLPLAEPRRRHLHQVIDARKLDTTHVTERRGRPYTLVCTKTRASYERALQAYNVDLDHLARLRSLRAWHEGLSAGPVRRGARRKGRKKRRP